MSTACTLEGDFSPHDVTDDVWEQVLLGDKELFKEMTEPCLPTLLKAAKRAIRRENRNGHLLDAPQPAELVGETLLQTWARRYNRPEHESLKHWLLHMQRWALIQITHKEMEWKKLTAVSLEAPIKNICPEEQDNEWIIPQEDLQEYWRDVTNESFANYAA